MKFLLVREDQFNQMRQALFAALRAIEVVSSNSGSMVLPDGLPVLVNSADEPTPSSSADNLDLPLNDPSKIKITKRSGWGDAIYKTVHLDKFTVEQAQEIVEPRVEHQAKDVRGLIRRALRNDRRFQRVRPGVYRKIVSPPQTAQLANGSGEREVV